MPARMTVKERAQPRPRKGQATAMRRARSRLAQTRFLASCVLVRERDHDMCRVCGSRVRVEVHHIVFRSKQGGHDPENLVCLCGSCHDHVHARRLWLTGPASALTVSVKKPGRAA